jgi:energy-converting hydrogenase A subunit M
VGSRRDALIKDELRKMLEEAQAIANRLDQWVDLAQDYDFQRQLKKIDAELIDFQHAISVAINMKEKG